MTDLWTPRIYTPHGLTKEPVPSGVRALDLGCGNRKLPGSIGVDQLSLPAVDVVHDLSQFPWPFKDNSIDLVFASHFLEHTTDLVRTMEEIYRILAPGGRVVAQMPYFRSVDAVTDPTHKRVITSSTFDYFVEGTKLFEYRYSNARFASLGTWYGWPQPSRNPLVRMVKYFMHKYPHAYDQFWSLAFPAACITWEFEALK